MEQVSPDIYIRASRDHQKRTIKNGCFAVINSKVYYLEMIGEELKSTTLSNLTRNDFIQFLDRLREIGFYIRTTYILPPKQLNIIKTKNDYNALMSTRVTAYSIAYNVKYSVEMYKKMSKEINKHTRENINIFKPQLGR
ncbi:hypothetical protein [Photobacterium leiognathi]|uniref:hypothetical protein n=1 Tax=Photobacterium leiognathi TaxID=553611 RepID=UPI0029816D1A|nr:hypothetical protein [Photobacterium leiognathi]